MMREETDLAAVAAVKEVDESAGAAATPETPLLSATDGLSLIRFKKLSHLLTSMFEMVFTSTCVLAAAQSDDASNRKFYGAIAVTLTLHALASGAYGHINHIEYTNLKHSQERKPFVHEYVPQTWQGLLIAGALTFFVAVEKLGENDWKAAAVYSLVLSVTATAVSAATGIAGNLLPCLFKKSGEATVTRGQPSINGGDDMVYTGKTL